MEWTLTDRQNTHTDFLFSLSPTKHPSVVVDNVTVRYLTPSSSKEDRASAGFLRRVATKIAGRQVRIPVYPVKNVSFLAYNGDSIGLIGENGAGKSTLLRVIGGFERPLEGDVWASSQPAHLGVNAALIPRLNAYRNAKIGLLAQGLSPKEADERIPEIIEYAGLGRAAHRAINTYSWGMNARLRFAISTAVHPRILLIDEALGGGDAAFAKKAKKEIEKILDEAGTIFNVNHNIAEIRRTCNRAIWINKGHIIADGDVNEVTTNYTKWMQYLGDGKNDAADSLLLECAKNYTPIHLDVHTQKPSLPTKSRHFTK